MGENEGVVIPVDIEVNDKDLSKLQQDFAALKEEVGKMANEYGEIIKSAGMYSKAGDQARNAHGQLVGILHQVSKLGSKILDDEQRQAEIDRERAAAGTTLREATERESDSKERLLNLEMKEAELSKTINSNAEQDIKSSKEVAKAEEDRVAAKQKLVIATRTLTRSENELKKFKDELIAKERQHAKLIEKEALTGKHSSQRTAKEAALPSQEKQLKMQIANKQALVNKWTEEKIRAKEVLEETSKLYELEVKRVHDKHANSSEELTSVQKELEAARESYNVDKAKADQAREYSKWVNSAEYATRREAELIKENGSAYNNAVAGMKNMKAEAAQVVGYWDKQIGLSHDLSRAFGETAVAQSKVLDEEQSMDGLVQQILTDIKEETRQKYEGLSVEEKYQKALAIELQYRQQAKDASAQLYAFESRIAAEKLKGISAGALKELEIKHEELKLNQQMYELAERQAARERMSFDASRKEDANMKRLDTQKAAVAMEEQMTEAILKQQEANHAILTSENAEDQILQRILQDKQQIAAYQENIRIGEQQIISYEQRGNEVAAQSVRNVVEQNKATLAYLQSSLKVNEALKQELVLRKQLERARTVKEAQNMDERLITEPLYEELELRREYLTASEMIKKMNDEISGAERKIRVYKEQQAGLALQLAEYEKAGLKAEAEKARMVMKEINEEIRFQQLIKGRAEAQRNIAKNEQAAFKENTANNKAMQRLEQSYYKINAAIRATLSSEKELPEETLKQITEVKKLRDLAEAILGNKTAIKMDDQEILALEKEIAAATQDILNGYGKLVGALKSRKQYKQELAEQTKNTGEEEAQGEKNATSNVYYHLRAVKMLNQAIRERQQMVNNALKTTLSASSRIMKTILQVGFAGAILTKRLLSVNKAARQFGINSKKATKSSDGFIGSLKTGIWTLIRYSIGVRSLYLLIGKLRSGLVEAMKALALHSSLVNKQISEMMSSLQYMKAAAATAAQPLLNVLVPAINAVADAFAKACYWIGSFFATLTGQKFVFKAVKTQMDYAASLDKSAQSAKDLKKELSGLDKLNVLTTEKDSGSGNNDGFGFEEVPLNQDAIDKANKLKDILSQLFDPLKKAWDRVGKVVMEAWKYALNEIGKLAKSIGKDFLEVWQQEATVKIFEDILMIFADIGLIIGNLASGIRKAWEYNNTGLHILEKIRDCIGIIVHGIRRCADLTVKWSEERDFQPLFDSINNALDDVKDGLQNIVDLCVELFNDIVLDGLTVIIEKYLPRVMRMIGLLVKAVGNLAKNFLQAWKNNERGRKILAQIERLFDIIFTAVEHCVEATEEWAATIDFNPLLEETYHLLILLETPIKALSELFEYFFQNVILKFGKYMVEEGLPKLEQGLERIVRAIDWEKFKENMKLAMDTLEDFLELAWEVFIQVLEDLGKAIGEFIASDGFKAFVETVKDWVANADPKEVANSIEFFVKALLALKGALFITSGALKFAEGVLAVKNAWPVLKGVATAMNNTFGPAAIAKLAGNIKNFFATAVTEINTGTTVLGRAVPGITTAAAGVAAAVAIAWAVDGLKKASAEQKEFLEQASDDLVGQLNAARDAIKVVYDKMNEDEAAAWVEATYGVEVGGLSMQEATAKVEADLQKQYDEIPKNLADGFFQGMKSEWSEGNILGALGGFLGWFVTYPLKFFGIASPSKVYADIGSNVAKGFFVGFEDTWKSLVDKALQLFDKIKTTAEKKLSAKTLVSAGKNVIKGLANGIKEGMKSAVDAVKSVADRVVSTARSVLKINSPSKVFYEIGEYISEGLGEGVEDGAKDVSDAFESLIPEDNQFTAFETQFVDMIARMTQESTSLFDVMIDSMNDKLANLNVQDSFGELSAKLREVSKIDIPKIAAGFTLPTDINVNVSKQNSSDSKEKVDLSDLPDMLYDAFVEALSTMPVNNNGDIVVEIDGKSVFTAVRSQNDIYKKRTGGVSAFA